MGERPSEYARDDADWYVEPDWTVDALIKAIPFDGMIYDPCCGGGTIPQAFARAGFNTAATDKYDRGYGQAYVDFRYNHLLIEFPNRGALNIVTNPPYSIAQSIIEKALDISTGRVAALVQTKFLSSQRRQKLFQRPDTEAVLIFSKRPSMPPGELLMREGEKCRGGGSIDFCWCVWDTRRTFDAATIRWIP